MLGTEYKTTAGQICYVFKASTEILENFHAASENEEVKEA